MDRPACKANLAVDFRRGPCDGSLKHRPHGLTASGRRSLPRRGPDTDADRMTEALLRARPTQRGRIRTILLASDLTPASEGAEDLAFELASGLGSSVLLVSVIDPGGQWLPGVGYRQRVDQVRASREASAQRIVERGHREGVPIRCLIWEGDPGESIVEAAVAESVDLIVVGTHGRRGMDRLVVGSVSGRGGRGAPVPVLVARGPAAWLSCGSGAGSGGPGGGGGERGL